jgi:long-chain acyl-CoA synthetase
MTETVFVHPSGTPVSTLPQAFQQTAALQPEAVAIRTVGDEVVITWRQYADRVRRIAAGLAALGVERGDTVGLMLRNRPEFHLADTAVIHLGAIPF